MQFLSVLKYLQRPKNRYLNYTLLNNIRNLSGKPSKAPKNNDLFKSSWKKYAFVAATSTAILLGLNSLKHRHIIDRHNPINVNPISNAKSLRTKFNFIDQVVKTCASSVVYIEIRDNKKTDPETGKFQTISNGSGFIVRDDGWILTNAHVVINKPQSSVVVMLNDGTSYTATVEDADMNIDLALLKINTDRKLSYLKLGNSSDVSTGEWVVALGSPLSLSHSVTAGVISSVNRAANELGLKNFSMHYIQTDAAITFGNSGGPLVNLDGDVIGINNLRVTAGIAFAIPVDYAKKFLERSHFSSRDQLSKIYLTKKNLGITTISVNPEVIEDLKNIHYNIPKDIQHGVLVWKIANGTPAYASGLVEGDIITHVNNTPVHEISDIYAYLGTDLWKLKLKIIHKGKKKEIVVKPVQDHDPIWSTLLP